MALRELLLPWDAQPQEVALPAIDLGPDALLWSAAHPQLLIGAANRLATSEGSPLVRPGPLGMARAWTRTANAGSLFGTFQHVPGTDLTVAVVGAPVASATERKVAFSQRTSSGSFPQHYVGFNSTSSVTVSSGLIVLTQRNTGATFSAVEASSQVDGALHAWVLANGTADGYIYRDGVAQTLTKNVRTTGTIFDSSQKTRIGNIGDYTTGGAFVSDDPIYLIIVWPRVLPEDQAQQLSADLARNLGAAFEPRRIFVPVVAGGGGSFSATGALSSDASTLSGTATHLTLHASSGALSSDASTIAGSANHIVVHPSSGALSSQDATLAGTALRYRQFSATGALDSASATIAGDAAHTTTGTFSATGALSAQDGTIAGTATHLTLHTATGAIQASDSTITGTAARLGTHDATGSLSADLASITGTVLHTGDGAEVVPLRTGGHAFMRERFAQARKRLALQRILSYLTEEEPAEETKRIIRAVKAGKPIQDKKPPVVMAEVSAEKIAEKLIPSRVADLAEIPDIDMQAVIKKAIRLAQERDDEDVLLLL